MLSCLLCLDAWLLAGEREVSDLLVRKSELYRFSHFVSYIPTM